MSCIFTGNVFSLVPSGKVGDIARMLKAIHAQEDRKAAADKMVSVIAELKTMKLVRAAELIEEHGQETLRSMPFPTATG